MSEIKKYFYNATVRSSSLEKEDVLWGVMQLDLSKSLEEQIVRESQYSACDIDSFTLNSLSEITDTSPIITGEQERKVIIKEFVSACLAKEMNSNETKVNDRGDLDYMWDLSDVEDFIPVYLKSLRSEKK